MAINPEDFKVNKTTTDVNVDRRAKFANKQGFDCQDCDNVVSADATGQNIIFTNYITGAQQTAQPTLQQGFQIGNAGVTTGEIARYGDKIWIKDSSFISEYIIYPNCYIAHVRTLEIHFSAMTSFGAGMCAKDDNTLILGSCSVVGVSGTNQIVELDISAPPTQGNTTQILYLNNVNVLFQAIGTIAGDIVYLPSTGDIVYSTADSIVHSNASGNILNQGFLPTNIVDPFSMWSFGNNVYFQAKDVLTGLTSSTYFFNISIGGSIAAIPFPQAPTPSLSVLANDAASTPECPPVITPPSYCYNIGDTGPGGGTIFSVPLGHPQNNGVNQSNFYYEVAKNDINTGGATPYPAYNQTCTGTFPPVQTSVDTSAKLVTGVLNNGVQFGYGPNSLNPNFTVSSINLNDPVEVFDTLGNSLFPTGSNAVITSIVTYPPFQSPNASSVSTCVVEFSVNYQGPAYGAKQATFTSTTIVGGFSAMGNEFGAHNKPIQTSIEFGEGKNNTDIIHSLPITPGAHPTLPSRQIAATECINYSTVGVYQGQQFIANDYFLPSLGEFEEIVNQMDLGNIPNINLLPFNQLTNEHVYRTSSAVRFDEPPGIVALPDINKVSWVYRNMTSPTGLQPNITLRCHPLSVRPIRRFECDIPPCQDPNIQNTCECVEYNYRDGQKGFVAGSYAGNDNHDVRLDPLYINWWTTNGGTTQGYHISQLGIVQNDDSCIGDKTWSGEIAREDVLGNHYSLNNPNATFNIANGSICYITLFDTEYNFIGKWKYTVDAAGSMGSYSRDTGKRRIRLDLDNCVHVEGNYPYVSYYRPPSPVTAPFFTMNPNYGRSITGIFMKLEFENLKNIQTFETGCNSTIFGNPHPFSSFNGSFDWPSYCGPIYDVNNGNYTGQNSIIPRYATFPPVNMAGNPIPVFPNAISISPPPSPPYTIPPSGVLQVYPNAGTLNHSCGCDYQVGDIGPAGGIIVAIPYMNINSFNQSGNPCIGPVVPALQGWPLKNYTDYYYEISPVNLNTPTDIIVFGNQQLGTNGVNLDLNIPYITPNTTLAYCPPINPASNINNEYVGQGEQATQDIMNTTGGNPTSAFPNPANTVQNAFEACDNYSLNGYNDWFLPTTYEMEFARNYTPPGTLQNTGSISQIPGFPSVADYYWTCNTVVSNTTGLNRIQEHIPTSINTPNNFALAVKSVPVNTNSGPHGYGWRTLLSRMYWLNVRAMRKFKCSNNSPETSRRAKFASKNDPIEYGPFGISGYYPLYSTIQGATSASPELSYHIHEFEGVEYYMPNGLQMGITQFHGNWKPEVEVEEYVQPHHIMDELEEKVTEEQRATLEQDQPQELPSVVTITPIEPEQEEEELPTPTYTPPPSTPSSGSGGGGY
tara:strand:+ start:43 stop:4155 length:4113 start_codon:yes stop_codon:yes gene_type:complete